MTNIVEVGRAATAPVAVALVGCGFIAQHHAAAYAADPRARLVAVCDVDPERARTFAARFGARAYPDLAAILAAEAVELVDVCTPQHQHVEPALTAIATGRHVFVEKPLALDLADAERLVRAARERGVRLATNFNRRFSRPYRLAHEYQAAGRLGAFAYLTLRIAVGYDPEAGSAAGAPPYHAAYDLLTHMADLARHFGGEVRRVSAHMTRRDGAHVWGNLAVALEFAGGGVGTILVSLESTRLHPIEAAEIAGTAGHALVHNVVGGFDFFPHDSELATRWRPQPFGGRERNLQFYPTTIVDHVSALLDALIEGREPPVTGADGVAALRIVLGAIESFESGRAVALDPGEAWA